MKSPASRFFLCAVFALMAVTGASRLAGATDDAWSFDVSPYLWAASAQVDSSLPNLPPSTPPDEPHFNSKITGALMIAGEARRGDFGLFADFDWLRLDTESAHPGPAFSAVNLRTDVRQWTVAATWHAVANQDWQVEFLAGARFWTLHGDQEFVHGLLPGFTQSQDRSWTDPIVGANVSCNFSATWFAAGKIVVGFGSDSTDAYDAWAGVGYRFTDSCSGVLGYRYLRENFAKDAFTWNLSAKGLLLGCSLRF